jgi:hypothetical protein
VFKWKEDSGVVGGEKASANEETMVEPREKKDWENVMRE